MPADDEPDDERAGSWVPHPDDRLWRHPSELGPASSPAGSLPAAAPLGADAPSTAPRRGSAVGALAGACLAGALVAFGAMWITRPTKVVERPAPTTLARSVATGATPFAVGSVPVRQLAGDLSASLARVQVERDGRWTTSSAVWIDGRGTLAAAASEVAAADQLVVTGADGVPRPATLAGVDEATAIAALVVDETAGVPLHLSSVPIGAGEPAVLVGAAGTTAGEDTGDATVATVTVRAASLRATVAGRVVHDAIQLDRPVPADAVGGALVDSDGHLIGLAVGTSTERDLGAVVPAETVMRVVGDLRQHGKVERAWLGVRAVDLDPTQASELGLPGGARITEVSASSPAATAGLRVGDVVTSIGDDRVDDASDLVVALAAHRGGTTVRLAITRDGARSTVTVTLG